MQTCTHCNQLLTLDCFHRRLDGHLTICKQCAKQKRQAKLDPLQLEIKKTRERIRDIKLLKTFEKLEHTRAMLERGTYRPSAPDYPKPKPVEGYAPFLDNLEKQTEPSKALQVLQDADNGIY